MKIDGIQFWDYLCNEIGYRFFAGVPCVGLNDLYLTMDKAIMHYVPAANEDIAVGIVNGATIVGAKAAVLMDHNLLSKTDLSFNIDNNIPLLVISSGEITTKNKKIKYVNITKEYKKYISKTIKELQNNNYKIVVFLFDEEI